MSKQRRCRLQTLHPGLKSWTAYFAPAAAQTLANFFPPYCCRSSVGETAVVRCGGHSPLQVRPGSEDCSRRLEFGSSAPTAAATDCCRLTALLPHSPRRVIPRAKLEQAAQHGVGLAYACMWLPAWGDSCLDDPAGVPVGEVRLVPDSSGAQRLPPDLPLPLPSASSVCTRTLPAQLRPACPALTLPSIQPCFCFFCCCSWAYALPAAVIAAPGAAAAHVLPWMPTHLTALVTMCREPPSQPWECCPRSGGWGRSNGWAGVLSVAEPGSGRAA